MAKPPVEIIRLEDSPPWLDQRLVTAYLRTNYRVVSLDMNLRIGVPNRQLDDWLEKNGHATFAVITAWNPRSEPLSRAENAVRNARLALEVRHPAWIVLPALGLGDTGDWTPEESFFVAGIPSRKTFALGRQFAQNAVVFGQKGQPPALWWL